MNKNANNLKSIDYKDVEMLKKHINQHSRIVARRHTDVSARSQRQIAQAIKRARYMGLLPYLSE